MLEPIVAIATGQASTAIGVIRLSGEGVIGAVEAIFRPASGRPFGESGDRRLVFGTLHDQAGAPIDQALGTLSRAPHSYTGEDTAELQCHGSPTVLALALEALFAQGVRQAGPGEFTKRAFLNGKLDLTQAEAVIDLIEAETPAAARCAARQLSGALARRLDGVYAGLVDVTAHFCAVLDYTDEDIDPFRQETIAAALSHAAGELNGLLATYDRGRNLVRGIPCAIVGRPNAGKSSLLNALVGYERAIVTDVPGTTRDTVEEKVQLGGVLLRLVDTAGLRETTDAVERLGVARSRAALETAQLALVLADPTAGIGPEDMAVLEEAVERVPRVIFVYTKADLQRYGTELPVMERQVPHIVSLSAKTGAGLDALAAAVAALFPPGAAEESGELLTNARQYSAALRAKNEVETAAAALAGGYPPDAVLADVEESLAALGELTGRTVREDVTARIFERFCVGK